MDDLNRIGICSGVDITRYISQGRQDGINLYSVPQTPSDRPVVRTISQLEMELYCRATVTFRCGLRNDLISFCAGNIFNSCAHINHGPTRESGQRASIGIIG
jgi:hypothetical protein